MFIFLPCRNAIVKCKLLPIATPLIEFHTSLYYSCRTYPYEHRLMAKIIGDAALKRANGDSREKIDQCYSKYSRNKRNIVLQHRPCFTEYDCDETWREWDNSLYNAVSKKFMEHNIVTIRGDDSYYTKCIECQVMVYKNADAIIGIHGAGMQIQEFYHGTSVLP